MKFQVARYIGHFPEVVRAGCHECVDEHGIAHILDLTTDASFPEFEKAEDKEAFMKSLVGREIEVERTYPYSPLQFAEGIRLLPHTETQR